MKQIIIVFFTLLQINCFAQSNSRTDNFHYKIIEILGDLNKDNQLDKVIVTQDTIDEKSPYKLQIFFKEPTGNFKLFLTSTKVIEPEFPIGKEWSSINGVPEITIKNGVLSIQIELTRGHYEHKFRFQNGNFELIGFTNVYANVRDIEIIDFNLSTGSRIEKTKRIGSDKLYRNSTKKVLVRPLPKLQDFSPNENQLY